MFYTVTWLHVVDIFAYNCIGKWVCLQKASLIHHKKEGYFNGEEIINPAAVGHL